MNAEPLFRADMEIPAAWFCNGCRRIAPNEGAADMCCRPKMCADCHVAEAEGGWAVCVTCRRTRETERETARYEAARKIPLAEYTGDQMYLPASDKYADVDMLEDWFEADDGPRPTYAYATERFDLHLSADSIVENALEEHHEDAEVDPWRVEALQRILDEWAGEAGVSSYRPDWSVVVLIPEPEDKE